MTAKTRERLKYELKHLVVLIIDEQSMVDSKSLRQTEKNIRETAYGGINEHLPWGNIPIIVLLGDDYQLPPVQNGAIHGFGIYILKYQTLF